MSLLNRLVLVIAFVYFCLVGPFRNGLDGDPFLRQLLIIPAWGFIIAGYFFLSGDGKLHERLKWSLFASIPFMVFCVPGVILSYWVGRLIGG